MKSLAIFLIIFIVNHKVAQSAVCDYYDQQSTSILIQGYTCRFRPEESDIDGNITSVGGEHDDFYHENPNDEAVLVVERGYTMGIKIFPFIICEKFINLQAIWIYEAGIEEIPEDSLINCKKLVYFEISDNRIRRLHANVFASQSELEILNLRDNAIEELPANVFAPLKKLRILKLQINRLKTLDSAAFGDHPELKEFYFFWNQLTSFDERIIDNNKALEVMDGSNNPCTEDVFNEKMEGRDKIKNALTKCFENNVESGNQVSDELMTTTEENNEQTTATGENNAEDLQMFFQSFATLMNAFGQAFNETENQVTTAIPDETAERSTAEISNESIKSINEKVDVLAEELNKTIAEIQSLKSENEAIKKKNQEFDDTIKALMGSNDELKADNEKINANIQLLIDEVKKLKNDKLLKDVKDDIDNTIW